MFKANDIVKNAKYGIGSVPRILDTINCFRNKFGSWPTRLRMDKGMAEAIQEHHITRLGWDALASKVDLQFNVEGTVIAEDGKGNSFEYISKNLHPIDRESSADFWVWGCEVWPTQE
jgi:hypothetical protein